MKRIYNNYPFALPVLTEAHLYSTMLTKSNCDANQVYYEKTARQINDGGMFIHKDTGDCYIIKNNKYVLDTKQKLSNFCAWCSIAWVMRNTDFSSVNNADKHTVFTSFMKSRRF